jgi:glutaminyl-tRNA synthetase
MTDTDKPTDNNQHFIARIIAEDLAGGKFPQGIQTRFPPEPNGYLHIGHAKSICLNFGLAQQFGGKCNLRFDDTNPEKESIEYIESIKADVTWLGFKWDRECYASDYFEQLYAWAQDLIKKGLAYVCDLSAEEMRSHRGTLTEPGRNSPFRERSPDENLELFEAMRAGQFADGEKILRAKIDMAHPNLNMRDPALYRIKRSHHHRTGDSWCIYPTYDFTHGQSDSLEGVTHSLCTLEFEDHRPLYNWFIEQLDIFPSRQIEFARLNLTYTVMSKRKLLQLVEEGHVEGWDDPRMPTLSGMRRRGYTPQAIRDFCDTLGITKFNATSDIALLEHAVRADLNRIAERRMVVFDPIKVVLTNYPSGQTETVEGVNNPEDPAAGSRQIPFSQTLFIERDDFMEEAPKKFFRLAPGREVRLRYAYVIRCDEVIKDAAGKITELRCHCDLDTIGKAPEGRKVKGVIHWVSAAHAKTVSVRQFDRLFSSERPGKDSDGDFLADLNHDSASTVKALAEPSLAEATAGTSFQFERIGYFVADNQLTQPGNPVFNRTVGLRDSWSKQQDKQ